MPSAYRWPEEVRVWIAWKRPDTARFDKRRMILDAAVTVFARQGFHHCRVSDVADEAGVAYGLVYHYFDSKEEILNELFLERWQIMLDAIAEIDAPRGGPGPGQALHGGRASSSTPIASEPDLMKVIIVEVTRAANSFGRLHLEKIREAYQGIAGIVEGARLDGRLQVRHLLRVRVDVLLRSDRAGAHGLDLRPAAPQTRRSTSTRRAWWLTRSAAASSPRRRMLRPCLVECPGPDGERPRQAPRSGAACSPEWAPSPRLWPRRGSAVGKALSTKMPFLVADGRPEAPPARLVPRPGRCSDVGDLSCGCPGRGRRRGAYAERPEVYVGAAFVGGLALAGSAEVPAGRMTPPSGNGADKSIGEIVQEVSEKASLLVREEIELAKAEVTSRRSRRWARGRAWAAAAGVFLIFAAVMFLETLAWFFVDLFESSVDLGRLRGLVTRNPS